MGFIINKTTTQTSNELENQVWTEVKRKIQNPKFLVSNIMPSGDLFVKAGNYATSIAISNIETEKSEKGHLTLKL